MRTPRHLPEFGSSTRGAPGAAAPLVGWSPGGRHSPPRFSEGSEAAASADAPPGRSAPKCCPRKERGSLRRFEPREDLAGEQQVPGAPSRPPFLLAHGPHLSFGPVPRVMCLAFAESGPRSAPGWCTRRGLRGTAPTPPRHSVLYKAAEKGGQKEVCMQGHVFIHMGKARTPEMRLNEAF